MLALVAAIALIVLAVFVATRKDRRQNRTVRKTKKHCITELPGGGLEITMNRDHGAVGDKHFTDCVGEVSRLKREGRHDEAIALLLRTVEATERETEAMGRGWGVAPWYYEQLAIVYRKEGRLEDEIAILERYARMTKAPGAGPDKLRVRLQKAKALMDKTRSGAKRESRPK